MVPLRRFLSYAVAPVSLILKIVSKVCSHEDSSAWMFLERVREAMSWRELSERALKKKVLQLFVQESS